MKHVLHPEHGCGCQLSGISAFPKAVLALAPSISKSHWQSGQVEFLKNSSATSALCTCCSQKSVGNRPGSQHTIELDHPIASLNVCYSDCCFLQQSVLLSCYWFYTADQQHTDPSCLNEPMSTVARSLA